MMSRSKARPSFIPSGAQEEWSCTGNKLLEFPRVAVVPIRAHAETIIDPTHLNVHETSSNSIFACLIYVWFHNGNRA